MSQRIALARALIRNARILILDEPVTGLDAVTEAQLSETLPGVARGLTTFVIAHRLATVRKADLILVLDGGRVTAQGTHSALLGTSDLYRSLWSLQYEEQERPRTRAEYGM